MNINTELKKIEYAEKKLIAEIDADVALENEIKAISEYTADILTRAPFAQFSIQNKHYVVAISVHNDANPPTIELVARERKHIELQNAKIYRANVQVDLRCSFKNNIYGGMEAILRWLTDKVKAESIG